TEPRSTADRNDFLRAARRIGDRLEQTAIRGKHDATWLGLTSIDQRHWTLMPLGIDLYDGLPGVILFLACLGEITEQERYIDLARAAFKTLQRQIERGRSSIISIGGFNGWGGVIYTLMRLSALWQDHSLIDQAEDLIDLVAGLIERDQDYDVIA